MLHVCTALVNDTMSQAQYVLRSTVFPPKTSEKKMITEHTFALFSSQRLLLQLHGTHVHRGIVQRVHVPHASWASVLLLSFLHDSNSRSPSFRGSRRCSPAQQEKYCKTLLCRSPRREIVDE